MTRWKILYFIINLRNSRFLRHQSPRMALPRSLTLVTPPIHVPKRVQNLVKSPIKVSAPSVSHLVASPCSEFGEKRPRMLVAAITIPSETSSGNPKTPLHPNKRQKRPKNTPEQSNASSQTRIFIDGRGFGDNALEFGTGFNNNESGCSTPHVSARRGRADSSITGQ
jgi:hypothetical protein